MVQTQAVVAKRDRYGALETTQRRCVSSFQQISQLAKVPDLFFTTDHCINASWASENFGCTSQRVCVALLPMPLGMIIRPVALPASARQLRWRSVKGIQRNTHFDLVCEKSNKTAQFRRVKQFLT